MIGELRPQGVAPLETHGAINAVDGKEGQRIGADEAPHALDVVGGREQFLAFRGIDSIIVRMRDRRRSDAEMHFLGAGVAHHPHDLHRRGAAHQGVVDQHDPLPGDHGAIGRMFEPHAELANGLARLDEGTSDVVIADDAELVGNA